MNFIPVIDQSLVSSSFCAYLNLVDIDSENKFRENGYIHKYR